MFSKIIMLVFLLVTFSTVMGFLKITKERVEADSAAAMAMQISDAIQATLHTATVSSRAIIPIPRTLPEKGTGADTSKLKEFTVLVNSTGSPDGKIIYVAVGWNAEPKIYAAATSFLADASLNLKFGGKAVNDYPPGLSFFSADSNSRYFIIAKNMSGCGLILCFKAAKSPETEIHCEC